MRELTKFLKRLKHYINGESGLCKRTVMGKEVDQDKIYYLEHLFLMTMMAVKYFFDGAKTECLLTVQYMLRLSTVVPDHKLSI